MLAQNAARSTTAPRVCEIKCETIYVTNDGITSDLHSLNGCVFVKWFSPCEVVRNSSALAKFLKKQKLPSRWLGFF